MAEHRDCQVLPVADFRPQTADSADPETMREIKTKEDMLKNVLCPFEPVIMYMQGVLVWEKPSQSVVLWLCVNGAFWFITITNYRIVFLLAMTGIVIVFVETFRNRIWPEIKVPGPDDNEEGWTPVHPKLLSVPELCHNLAETWVWCCTFWDSIWVMRTEQPGKFCLWTCSICSVLVIVGHYIPGVMISYIVVLSLLLWPVVEYHNINQKIYNKLEPVWMQLEYSMVRRGRRKKTSKQRKQLDAKDDGTALRDESSSESESDIAEFMPSPNFETTAALARAVTDPDSASEMSEEEAAGLLGRLSREPSFGRITDEDVHTDNEGNFMAGIGEIPAHDDSMLQESADALHLDFVPTIHIETAQTQETTSKPSHIPDETMHFVVSHFDDSDHESLDDRSISHGLEFPDITDLTPRSQHTSSAASSTLGTKTSDFVSQTVSTVMQGTYSAIRQSKQTIFGGHTETNQQTHQQPGSDNSDKPTLATPQTPSDIDADEAGFEMLDPVDLDSYDEHAVNDGLQSQDAGKGSYLGWLRKN